MSEGSPDPSGRRDFIKGAAVLIGSFIGTLIGLPSLAYLLSPVSEGSDSGAWVDLGPLDEYPVEAPTLFEFSRTRVNGWERTAIPYGVFVVRSGPMTVRVFSNICTHLACHVNWQPDIQHFVSPCHDGHFDMLGRNISGPPPRPLDEFTTRIEEGHLYIELPAFRRSS